VNETSAIITPQTTTARDSDTITWHHRVAISMQHQRAIALQNRRCHGNTHVTSALERSRLRTGSLHLLYMSRIWCKSCDFVVELEG